jgi:hypothetical protein
VFQINVAGGDSHKISLLILLISYCCASNKKKGINSGKIVNLWQKELTN